MADNEDPWGRNRLRAVLADHEQKSRHFARQTMHDAPAALTELAQLWNTHTPDLHADVVPDFDFLTQLQSAEHKLSHYAHSLLVRFDEISVELGARYEENPELALVALYERLLATP